jgi:hypothetical protein
MLDNAKCQTLANDLRSLLAHKDITVAGVAEVWVPTLDRAAEHAEPTPSASHNTGMDAIALVLVMAERFHVGTVVDEGWMRTIREVAQQHHA